MKQYKTEGDWLSDKRPYGKYVQCSQCSRKVEVLHIDIFHKGTCACGSTVDEPCNYHSFLGKCQADKTEG